MKFKDLIGHRIIYKNTDYTWRNHVEIFILELSPSGKRVKLRFPSSIEQWECINNDDEPDSVYDKGIIEDLGLFKKRRKRK